MFSRRVIANYTAHQWETHAVFLFLCTTWIFDHNFGSRHAGKQIKGSIDAEDRLVSTKSLSHKNGPLDRRPGGVKVGQIFLHCAKTFFRNWHKSSHISADKTRSTFRCRVWNWDECNAQFLCNFDLHECTNT